MSACCAPSISNHRRRDPPNLLHDPQRPPDPVQAQPRRLKLGHEMRALEIQPQRLVLVEQPVPGQLLLERRVLICQELTMNQPLLADLTNGQCRRAGKAAAAVATQPARADLALAEAMNAAPAGVAPIADPTQLRQVGDRAAAARAPSCRYL